MKVEMKDSILKREECAAQHKWWRMPEGTFQYETIFSIVFDLQPTRCSW